MAIHQTILLVACNHQNLTLLSQLLVKTGYITKSIYALEELETLLTHSFLWSLALIDIAGYDSSIWRYCKTLSDHGVPLLVIAPQEHYHIQYKCYAYGAKSVLFKPLIPQKLLVRISELLVEV